ncbi:MAG: helix-turn-helix transcriptional regulator [Ignavibacteriaceae bacterium]|nr:helix-turn-helix transcriptional regulator [Ignavibacteriaceae bacterium]
MFFEIMQDFRLSQNDLAKISGIQQSTINRITRGLTKSPYPATIKKLEQNLEICINFKNKDELSYIKQNDLMKRKSVDDLLFSQIQQGINILDELRKRLNYQIDDLKISYTELINSLKEYSND